MRAPTPKKVRYHYGRVARLRHELSQALLDAYQANVIVYDKDENHVVCDLLYDCWEQFKIHTEKTMADAIRTEIMKELKGIY